MNNLLKKSDQQIDEINYFSAKSAIAVKSVKLIRHYLDNSILHADINVYDQIENESMVVLYELVMEDLNKVIDVECGENTIKSYSSNIDFSPDHISDRIVSNAVAYFPKYLDQQPEQADLQAVQLFVEAIGFGIDKGFAEARNILDELMVLEGNIERNIDVTYDLVQIGLQAFVEK